ncbi:MAG TPA: hypothetical protein VJB12_05565 [Candidatus Nanoarchaeia archaeon]|nr:hypothetical protein [Candidatus Nanoarchaeia archaeon]
MHKPLLSILVVFLFFASPISSQTTLTYEETQKVALDVIAKDPDGDPLAVEYTPPISRKGEWQTDYGDAGIYRLNISVSDGEMRDVEEVVLVINRKESAPSITSFRPLPASLGLEEGKTLSFSVRAMDSNKDRLEYLWALDGINVSSANSFAYSPAFDQSGSHVLEAKIFDGKFITIKSWEIAVEDVDLGQLVMEKITDASFKEGEIARIPLPDFRHYGLSYTLTFPLEKNLWKTDYNSSGVYKVVAHVTGRGFDEKKTIRITIKDVDRAPHFDPIPPQFISEGQTLTLMPIVSDPDGDGISVSLNIERDGLEFHDGIVRFTPSFDAVTNSEPLSSLSRKFHALHRVVMIELEAKSKNLTAIQKIPITIFNTNRAPQLDPLAPVTLKEGEIFTYGASANDPDGDPISYTYKSTLKVGEPIGYNSQGVHLLKVTASDGFLSDSSSIPITVQNANRPAVLKTVKDIAAKENETIEILLDAKDPDNDEVDIALLEYPPGMGISGNTIIWTPPFSAASRDYSVVVQASDGSSQANTIFTIHVSHENRRPAIQGQNPQILSGKAGVALLLPSNAEDLDGDPLSYSWDFGIFDSYEGGSSHERTYISAGKKKASVTISDGDFSVEKEFLITII